MKRNSLRLRIIWSFALSGLLMGALFGGIVYGYLHTMEDDIIVKTIKQEAQAIQASIEIGEEVILPRSRALNGELSYQKPDVNEGLHEEGEIHYLCEPTSDGRWLLLIHHDKEVEPLEGSFLAKACITGMIAVFIANILLAFGIANRLLYPLIGLTRTVKKAFPDPLHLSKVEVDNFPDELGVLANALQDANQRVEAFIQREKRFTADASHELRTPLAVVKSAVALAQKKVEQPSPEWTRIHRGIKDMESTIETFLYLSRQGSHPMESEACDLKEVVDEVVQANRYLLQDKPVELLVSLQSEVVIEAVEPMLRIAINNVVRNAFQHTNKGNIFIQLDGFELKVENSTPLQLNGPNKEPSFGLGLQIVDELCKTNGWTWQTTQKDQTTKTNLKFRMDVR